MKASEYRQMNRDELEDKLEEMQKHLFEIKCQSVTETIENCKASRNIRHDIARIKTIMREEK